MSSRPGRIDRSATGTTAMGHAFAGTGGLPTGWFAYHRGDHRWYWSDELARIFGYEPGDIVPTTDLLLSHRHPDDIRPCTATLDRIVRSRATLAVHYRMIDRHDDEHAMVAYLEPLHDARGLAMGTHGRCIDVTAIGRGATLRSAP